MEALYNLFDITNSNLFDTLTNIYEDFGYWISSILNGLFRTLFFMFNDRELNFENLDNYIPFINSSILAEATCFIISIFILSLVVKLLTYIGKTFIELAKDLKQQMKLNAYLDKKGGRKKIKLW